MSFLVYFLGIVAEDADYPVRLSWTGLVVLGTGTELPGTVY